MELIQQIIAIFSLIVGVIAGVWVTLSEDFMIGMLSGIMAIMLTWMFSMFISVIVMSALGI